MLMQESRVVRVIKRQLVKRSLEMLKAVSERPAEGDKKSDYSTFWESFGRNLKLGCIEDQANRKALSELLRFPSSQTGDGLTSLKEYTSRYVSQGRAGQFAVGNINASMHCTRHIRHASRCVLQGRAYQFAVDNTNASLHCTRHD